MTREQFGNRLSLEEMNRDVGKLKSCVTQLRAAGIFLMCQRVWNRNLTHGDPSHRHGRGRNRATTQRQGYFILIRTPRKRFQNATSLNDEFTNRTGFGFLHK